MGSAYCETWSRATAVKLPVRYDDKPPRYSVSEPHPRILQATTWVLSGVTVIALLALVSLFVAPQFLVAEDRPHDLVLRFYAAANEILAGGSSAALEDVVSPDLLDHQPGMPSGDRAALLRRLTDLRLAAPGVRLHVSAIVEEGEWAAARVTTLGLRLVVRNVPLELAPEPPVQTEFFRIVDNRIVEYWSAGPAIDLPRALPPIAVAPWVTDTTISLARLTFPSGARLSDLDSPGEHLILLESGELEVSLSGAASLFAVAHPEAGWQATPVSGHQLVLRAGDALLVSPSTRHAITNYRAGPATILGVAMIPAADLAIVERQQEAGDAQLLSLYDPSRIGMRATWDRHVSVNGLVAGVGEARFGPCAAMARTQVTVTHFTLGPGAALPAHDVEGIEFVAINAGGLAVDTFDLISEATPAIEPLDGRVNVNTIARTTGHGLSLSSGSAASGPALAIRNVGPLPLDLVHLALEPTAETSCAISPVDT